MDLKKPGFCFLNVLPEGSVFEVCRYVDEEALSSHFLSVGRFATAPALQQLRRSASKHLHLPSESALLECYASGRVSADELSFQLLQNSRQLEEDAELPLPTRFDAVTSFEFWNDAEQAAFARGVVRWWKGQDQRVRQLAVQRFSRSSLHFSAAAFVMTCLLWEGLEGSHDLGPILLELGDVLLEFSELVVSRLRRAAGQMPVLPFRRTHVAHLMPAILACMARARHDGTGISDLTDAVHGLLFSGAREFHRRVQACSMPQTHGWLRAARIFGAVLKLQSVYEVSGPLQLIADGQQVEDSFLGELKACGHLSADTAFWLYGAWARQVSNERSGHGSASTNFPLGSLSRHDLADLLAIHAASSSSTAMGCDRTQWFRCFSARRWELLQAFEQLLRCEQAYAKWLLCPGYTPPRAQIY